MLGFPLSQDRRWLIKTPEFEAEMAEYNSEITGFDFRLGELSDAFVYGGNAYYVLNTLAVKRGWHVTEIPRKG